MQKKLVTDLRTANRKRGKPPKSGVGFFWLWLWIFLILFPQQACAEASRLAIILKAPEFTLTSQDGKTVRMADFKGKVLLVSFVFTTCNGSCPATTHRMEKVQTALKGQGLLKNGKVHLLSITLDPTRDKPEVLRRYMQLYDADPAGWTFLTGSKEKVAKVIAVWGMWARPADNGQLDHPSRIFLVDQRGRIREIYNLSFMKPGWVMEDIEVLLKEKGASSQ
jgi:protein SCO1/2